jgi:hypothetical protein
MGASAGAIPNHCKIDAKRPGPRAGQQRPRVTTTATGQGVVASPGPDNTDGDYPSRPA